MIVGCYDLHLYCDAPEHGKVPLGLAAYERHLGFSPGMYTGKSEAEAIKNARKVGWRVNTRARTAFCPDHKSK